MCNFEKKERSIILPKSLIRRFVVGFLKAFPRYAVVVGFILLFVPQYISAEAHIVWKSLVWVVYVSVPLLLWNIFNFWDKVLDRYVENKTNNARCKNRISVSE